jgi:glyoxylase-like metal-dependent hydrolase (beta-lactamase superfamily II)
LAGRSTKVDHVLHDGDEVLLEEGLSIHAYRTAGHSAGEMSYRLEDAFFIGDTVPVITDIPIIIDVPEMIASIKMLRCQKGIRSFYPAWDHAYSAEEMKEKLEQAEELIMNLGKAIAESDVGQDLRDLTMLVSEEMKLQMFSENPLFAKTVGAFRKEWK